MNAWIYNASLYCDDCAKKIITELNKDKVIDTGDSGNYPQGPYPDGGGEADSPQHCDQCQLFLENELTTEGISYLFDAVCNFIAEDWGDRKIIKNWVDFYDVTLEELLDNAEYSR